MTDYFGFNSVFNGASPDLTNREPQPQPDFAYEHVDLPYIIVASVICGLGLLGNLVAIVVIMISMVLKEYQKSVTHWYILQLAIVDTIFLITLPLKLKAHIASYWIFPEWLCKASETIFFLNYYASIIFLVVMSVDMNIAVCQPDSPKFQQLRKRTSAFIVAICVWVCALALTIPVMIHSFKVGFHPFCHCTYEFDKFAADQASACQSVDYEEGSKQFEACLTLSNFAQVENGLLHCRQFHAGDPIDFLGELEDYEYIYNYESGSGSGDYAELGDFINPSCHYFNHPIGWKVFIYFNFVGMFILPFIIIVFAYAMIIRRLHATRMNGASAASSDSDKYRRRVTIMCAALVISFMVCWTPFHTVHLIKFRGLVNTEDKYCDWLQRIADTFAYLSAAINPFLYSILGTHFLKRWRLGTSSQALPGNHRFVASVPLQELDRHPSNAPRGNLEEKTAYKQ